MMFSPVMVDSGKMTVESAMRIQSLRTPATRIVTAPVLPITKNMAKFKARAHRAFEKKIQKLNWICATSIVGFSKTYQGNARKTKLHKDTSVVEQTLEVGTQTAANLKGQTDQMGRVVNHLDTIQFSIKKASQLVKEIGRQVATDKCIMMFLFLIVCGVIAIIVVKIVNPNNKDIRDIPGLAPPAQSRKLLYLRNPEYMGR
ncbi:hypothetical protein F2Q68_00017492 [Brassica cretica]|uniref:t-SNARE coiled-coil homology domain-containing protein n=1 Tax=Brassica cretica TaxID=69181 RepID=A0A8S9HHS1_BRACR|nr:hypothetical protein F2Q68_00017492 [Brassica cretica]